MTIFTDTELAYLQARRLGRLATTGKAGVPHVVPVGFRLDAEKGSIRIGGHSLEGRGQDRLYVRHVTANPKAAFVVDDIVTEPTWTPSGVTIKGDVVVHAEGGEDIGPGFGPQWIEITPTWVSSWGVDNSPYEPSVPRKA